MDPWWIPVVLGAVVTIAALVFIWFGRGTADANEIQIPVIHMPLVKGTSALVALVAGISLSVWSVQQLTESQDRILPAGEVIRITGIPPFPADPTQESVGHWLLAMFEDGRYQVSLAGLQEGDYVVALDDASKAKNLPQDDLAQLRDSTSVLLRVVHVFSDHAECRMDSFVIDALEGAEDQDDPLALSPIREGDAVIEVPLEEGLESDRIDTLLAQADEAGSERARSFLYRQASTAAEDFLHIHGTNAFFSPDVTFSKGIAEFESGRLRASLVTFERFQEDYPFSPSADGAREWAARISRALGQNPESPFE